MLQKGHTMPNITYIIRFVHCDKNTSVPYEEQEHLTAEAAWTAFRLFAEPDSFGIYSLIELVEYNREEEQEYPLAQLTFPV